MATTVNVYEAKTRLSALLNLVEAGEEIIIARNGRPIARLGPLTTEVPNRVPGAWRGRIHIADDFDDFTEQDEADWYGPIEPAE
jgi:prevent-host-death family protein